MRQRADFHIQCFVYFFATDFVSAGFYSWSLATVYRSENET